MNPISRLGVYLTFTFSTLLSFTIELILIHLLIAIGLIIVEKQHWNEWKSRTRPFWKYFPVTGILFFTISFIVVDRSPEDIFYDVSTATVRLLILVSVMTIYFIQSKGHDIILALRSIWFKSGKPIKWVEDVLLYFDITVRFFPSLQEEWRQIERSQKALSMPQEKSTLKKAMQIANFIPDFILLNLSKTETITHVIEQRGYGKTFPRSVYPFIPFKWIDGMLLLIFPLIALGVHTFV